MKIKVLHPISASKRIVLERYVEPLERPYDVPLDVKWEECFPVDIVRKSPEKLATIGDVFEGVQRRHD